MWIRGGKGSKFTASLQSKVSRRAVQETNKKVRIGNRAGINIDIELNDTI